MELALPHVVVRVYAPTIGADLVAALTVHPIEVSEARDPPEARRVAAGRPAMLVIVAEPPDAGTALTEIRETFPCVPILVVSDAASAAPPSPPSDGGATAAWFEWIPASQPLEDICWHVLEAVSRAGSRRGVAERPIGPTKLELDERGIVVSDYADLTDLHIRRGDSLLDRVAPLDRQSFTAAVARAARGTTRFCCIRLRNAHGGHHTVSAGLHGCRPGRVLLLLQPLIGGGPIMGRHINSRDPITGLLTRWAISRMLDRRERLTGPATPSSVLLLTIDDAAAIASTIGSRRTDILLGLVAAVLTRIFPHPAVSSRLMGDTFLTYMPDAAASAQARRIDALIPELALIDVPGFAPGFRLRTSLGIADVASGDHDLALRLAEMAVAEAQAAGGNRVVFAGSGIFTPAQAQELEAEMELGAWEVWLQPVVAPGTGQPAFHEALARFASGRRRVASRADFFMAGRAAGLLERFDRMMLMRALRILAARPGERLSVNVSHETFAADTFPGSFLDLIRELPAAGERIILEIAPRCMAAPADEVRTRLRSLTEAGIAVAIDDFGSGICRLRTVTQFPIAIVKLDRLVTGYIDDDPLQREFVRTVVSLCRARGITTVAEYTHDAEQLTRLVNDGVDLFQGELFGMPRPAEEVLAAAMAGNSP